MKPRYWHISYDIADPKRLRRIARLCLQHGDRIQKSLYLCALSPEQRELLERQFREHLTQEDRLMLRPICKHCRAQARTQGAGGHPERLEPFWIV